MGKTPGDVTKHDENMSSNTIVRASWYVVGLSHGFKGVTKINFVSYVPGGC